MENAISLWKQLEGSDGLKPPWTDRNTRTIRFSNTVARELATLITQNIDIKAEALFAASGKADFIQKSLDKSFLVNAQENVEMMIRLGGIMAKWNGNGIDYIPPDRFLVTGFDSNKEINGCIFFSYYNENGKFYTRAEWHRYEMANRTDENGAVTATRIYLVSNKAFVSDNMDVIGRETSLKNTRWADIEPETRIANLEKPLFSYLKCPYSNTVDPDSPLGVSLFSECVEELRWLDIAMSAMGVETEDSTPIMFVDNAAVQYATNNGIKLPKFIKGMDMGVTPDKTIQEWTPTLQVASRIDGINFYLSIISYKCGFDPGYFVFNGQSISIATATQVEATERRTVNTVLSFRNLLDRPNSNGDGRVGVVHDIAYIIDTMSVMSGETAPGDYGNYKLYCDFADLTANKEENKAFDYQLAQQGYMSKVRFLVRNLGMTEEEAKIMVAEAQEEKQKESKATGGGLFGEE